MPDRYLTTALAPETPEDLNDLEELRTLVTLCRTHRRDIGERQIFVRIDDGPRVALRFGQSFTLEVKPGRHQLRANNTLFWRTVTFTSRPASTSSSCSSTRAGRSRTGSRRCWGRRRCF